MHPMTLADVLKLIESEGLPRASDVSNTTRGNYQGHTAHPV